MPPKDTGPFRHSEKVLVPHTDKHYQAKVMKSEKRDDGLWYYLIHYKGWSKQWDEWVEAPGLRKFDPKLVEGEDDKEGDGPGAKRKASGLKRPEKRRKMNDISQQDAELPGEAGDPAVEVRLPAALKQILVDEHASVEKGLRLPPLPHKPTVTEILNQYVEESRATRQIVEVEEQAATGLRVYFDKALHPCLLYDHEVEECEKVLTEGTVPSTLYGGEHLLRLCAKMPDLVPISSAPSEGYAALEEQLAAFAAFLARHQQEFFTATYHAGNR